MFAGTTVKGAIDDLDGIIATLQKCGFAGRFYIHCDGALAGLMMPFIKQVSYQMKFFIYLINCPTSYILLVLSDQNKKNKLY